MPKSKTPKPQSSRNRDEAATVANAIAAAAAASRSTAADDANVLPGDIQMQVDVHVCLLDAMTDNFPIRRSEIGAKTVPNKPPIGADGQGWGICLASLGEKLRLLRSVYAFYVHKPLYTEETIDKPFPDIVLYIKQKLLNQFLGRDP